MEKELFRKQDGEREGRRSCCCFGKTRLQGRRSPSLSTAIPWPLATSVILMVHIWFHMGEEQAAVLAKQTPQPQDFALRSLGVIRPAQSPLCITKQGSLCALGFSFVLPLGPSQRNATIHHLIPNKRAQTQLKDRVLPSCFPSPGKCGSCL